ncbi:hypothetical protein [Herbaspirillum sp. ST 5-3]|uniref:hypothetical protein n=1 Tax=Oxalobacteraceae TaxID=75682 RepID=UPI0010A4300D|nr:hypothetical protein [Herbaspirillum sp. ST 5-3]
MKMRQAKRAKNARHASHVAWCKLMSEIIARNFARVIDDVMCRVLYRIYQPYIDICAEVRDVLTKAWQEAAQMKEQP